MLLRRYWRWIKVNIILAVNSHGGWLTSWCPGTANVHASLIKPFALDGRVCPFFSLSTGAGLTQKRFALVSLQCFSAKLAWITRTPHSLRLLPRAQVLQSPQLDVGELQVTHDLQLVDAAQVLRAVSEVKQVGSVYCHLELVRLTQDQNLKQE